MKHTTCSDHFWAFRLHFFRQAQWISAKREGFATQKKRDHSRGAIKKKDLQFDQFARQVKETPPADMLGGQVPRPGRTLL